MRNFFVILSVFFVLFSFYPSIYEYSQRYRLPAVRSFELVHNYYTDFNFYLSRIRQGIEGRKTVVEKYTSEPHAGSFIHGFYLALGWAGGWVRVPWDRASDVYHVARIVLGFALLLMLVNVLQRTFKTFFWQIIAYLIVVTASTWPKIVTVGDTWRFGGYMPWWTVMDSLERIDFVPHLLAGQVLMMFLLDAVNEASVIRLPKNWIFLGILSLLLGFIFPPGLVFLYASFGVGLAMRFIFYTKHNTSRLSFLRKFLLPWFFVGMISFPALLYLQLMVTFFPWKQLALQDILHPLPFQYKEYFFAVGPVLPLGIIGLVWALIRKEKRMTAFVVWVLTWVLLLWVFKFIPSQSPLRFSQMLPHVPLGILTTYLVFELFSFVISGTKTRALTKYFNKYVVQYIIIIALLFVYLIPSLLILSGLGVMYSSWLWQRDFVNHKISAGYPYVPYGAYVMYPLKDFISAIKFIQDTTSRDTIVLTETTAGNYIPVYAGNTVYVGHDNTIKNDEKKQLVREFFSGKMPEINALELLKQNNIKIVFYGPQERDDGGPTTLTDVYSFLTRTYENSFFEVYTVNK